ncbi:MAG: hypothetical protein FJX31_01825 [Alphaproteobacteria bacterium]|nr:hypothetical protein [Alphaproteobacteria bacterium]
MRIAAISQLFFVVPANYGDGWLASDNPILTVRNRPAPGDPLAAPTPVKEAPLWSSGRSDFAGSPGEDRKLDANGWGSGEDAEPEAAEEPWVPDEGDGSGNAESAPEADDWGLGA